MSELSTPLEDPSPRRRYHSPARRQRAAATRERIIDAGARLVRGFTTWDWDELTFKAVAERAGVSERTVYRNFPSERHLHDAIMARLEDEAGISYEDVELDNLADVTARVFASLRRFAIKDTVGAPRGPAFAGADARRHDALNRAVTARAPELRDAQHRALAGLLDVLWSPPTYERLIGAWSLDNAEAVSAVQWLIAKVIAAVDDNEPPILSA
jgi:AcrR family transcriptional regulator